MQPLFLSVTGSFCSCRMERSPDRIYLGKRRERGMKKKLRKWAAAFCMFLVMLCAVSISHAEAKDVVVVIDPGHGGTEAGAYRKWSFGTFREELLNLKISQYLKAELETYSGVKVYMTRNNNSKTMNREQRIKIAKNYNADALVSVHINSTGADKQKTATGAFAIVPSLSGYPNSNKYAKMARTLGTVILQQLNAVSGLKNNGYWLDDELGIILYGMKYKVPSIIIEHCYINNPDDCKKYLNSEAALKKLGVGDATGIAKYFNLPKKGAAAETPAETPEDTTTPEMAADYVITGWQQMGSKYYYFDRYGVMQVGVTKIGSSLYLLDNNGARKTGFVKLNGKQYYADSKGKLKLGWQTYKGKKYYFSTKTGAALTGLQTISKKQYYFDKNGVMKTKWVTIKGKKYYFSKVDGRLLKNYWLKYNGKWYYLNSKGTPYVSTKKKIKGKTYKFDKKGICTNK